MSKKQFDDMGQPVGTPVGEPDAAAVEAVENAQGLKPLIEPAPSRKRKPKADKAIDPVAKEAIAEALKDPDILRQVVTPEMVARIIDTASQTPGQREALNLSRDVVLPSEDYSRNYQAEPALRVYGGVEVEHDQDFRANPPSYVTKFVAEDEMLGKCDQEDLAKKGPDGKPILTDEYKQFLHVRKNGGRLDGKVRFDIATDNFTPGDTGIAV